LPRDLVVESRGEWPAPSAQRNWPLVRRIIRYGFSGLTVSIFYSLAVIGCVSAFRAVSPTAASIIAFLLTLPFGYLTHGRISFSDRPFDTLQPLRFVVSTSASLVIAVGGMYWITEVAGRSYLLGIAWNWLTIPAMNFLIYIFWVFPARNPRERLGGFG
jgi:putative flippase GtrA